MSMNDYGLLVAGNIRVFRKDKELQGKNKVKYTVSDVWFNVSEKEEDGTWTNKPMDLYFKRDAEKPENNTIITITKGFFFLTGSGGYRRIALYVQEWHNPEE